MAKEFRTKLPVGGVKEIQPKTGDPADEVEVRLIRNVKIGGEIVGPGTEKKTLMVDPDTARSLVRGQSAELVDSKALDVEPVAKPDFGPASGIASEDGPAPAGVVEIDPIDKALGEDTVATGKGKGKGK